LTCKLHVYNSLYVNRGLFVGAYLNNPGYGNNALANFTTNSGLFTIQNGVNLTSAMSNFFNPGTMTVGDRSTFTVGGLHSYLNSGLLQGTGTVETGLLINSGTVHPGLSQGILSISGNYQQTASGILDIALGGSSGYSVQAVSGLASLGGMLDLGLIGGFTPYIGEEFVILTWGGLSGEFTDNTIVIGNVVFNVEYSPDGYANDVVVEASVSSPTVPEPSTMLIFSIGLATMGLVVARRSPGKHTAG
jgi:PEP-CTERM motif